MAFSAASAGLRMEAGEAEPAPDDMLITDVTERRSYGRCASGHWLRVVPSGNRLLAHHRPAVPSDG